MPRKETDLNNPRTYCICMICDEKMNSIAHSHLKLHGMTMREYRDRFPDAPLFSPIAKEKRSKQTSEQMKKRFQDSEYMEHWKKKKSKDMNKIWSEDDGTRRKIAGNNLSKAVTELHKDPIWKAKNIAAHSVGLKKKWKEDVEYRKRVSRGVSKELKRRWSEDRKYRKRMQEIAYGNMKQLWAEQPGVCLLGCFRGGHASAKAMWESPLNRQLASQRSISRLGDPNDNWGQRRFKYREYRGIYFRSSWEIKFAKLLDNLGIDWAYEPRIFQVTKMRRYLPDFYIPILSLYVEIKPQRFINKWVKTKLKAVEDTGEKIVLLTEKDLPFRKSSIDSSKDDICSLMTDKLCA